MAEMMDRATAQVLTWAYQAGDKLHREEGQDAMEYAVVAAVVVVVVAGAAGVFTNSIQGAISAAFTKINTTIASIA